MGLLLFSFSFLWRQEIFIVVLSHRYQKKPFTLGAFLHYEQKHVADHRAVALTAGCSCTVGNTELILLSLKAGKECLVNFGRNSRDDDSELSYNELASHKLFSFEHFSEAVICQAETIGGCNQAPLGTLCSSRWLSLSTGRGGAGALD